jgi:hypothetical protein
MQRYGLFLNLQIIPGFFSKKITSFFMKNPKTKGGIRVIQSAEGQKTHNL